MEYSVDGSDVEDYLIDFRDELDAEEVDDRPIHEALWYITTYANGKNYTAPSNPTESISMDTIVIELDSIGVSEGSEWIVSGNDILDSYNDVNDEVANITGEEFIGMGVKSIDYNSGLASVTIFLLSSNVSGINFSCTWSYSGAQIRAIDYPRCNAQGDLPYNVADYLEPHLNAAISPLDIDACNHVSCIDERHVPYEFKRTPPPGVDPDSDPDGRLFLYCELYDYCLDAGNSTDNYYNNSAQNSINGYYKSAITMMNFQNASYTQSNRHIQNCWFFGYEQSPYQGYNCKDAHILGWWSARIQCVSTTVFD